MVLLKKYVSIIDMDFLYIHIGSIVNATERWIFKKKKPTRVCHLNLTVHDWVLTSEMIWIWNLYFFMYTQYTGHKKGEMIVWRSGWSCWDLWIYSGQGFISVQHWSCFSMIYNIQDCFNIIMPFYLYRKCDYEVIAISQTLSLWCKV